MLTPADLHARRDAMGVSRHTVAELSGLTFELIRRNERPTFHVIMPVHVAALERIKAAYDALADILVDEAMREAEGGFEILLWDYHADEFAEMCPHVSAAIGYLDIYRAAMLEAMRIIEAGDDAPEVHVARMIRAQYLAFMPGGGLPDSQTTRRKWWRSYSQLYRMGG